MQPGVTGVLMTVGAPDAGGPLPGVHLQRPGWSGGSRARVDEADPAVLSAAFGVGPSECRAASTRGDVGVQVRAGDRRRARQERVAPGQVPRAKHAVATTGVDRPVVGAEADAPALLEGLPALEWSTGGDVPDDQLAVVRV